MDPYCSLYYKLLGDYVHFQAKQTVAPEIKNVIFNSPATVVYWRDGTKTIVKCQPCDTYNSETGLMAAILKKLMGNDNTYNKVLAKWLPDEGFNNRECDSCRNQNNFKDNSPCTECTDKNNKYKRMRDKTRLNDD